MLDYLKQSFTPVDDRADALLEEACNYINRIHRVKGISTCAFHYAEIRGSVHGEHYQGEEIVVSTKTQFPVLAAIHELGHAIDGVFLNSAQGFGTPDDPYPSFGSELAEKDVTTLLGHRLAAVSASTYCRSLKRALAERSLAAGQAQEILKLLGVRECWARSYEMFVAYRNPGTALARQMDVERGLWTQIGGVVVHNYWQRDDFEEVEVCIVRIFEKLQWLM